jgi:hypothetical protein
LHKITCPTLILGAKDDPLMMPVPRPTIARNKRLLLVETEDGGHMGWVTWREKPPGIHGTESEKSLGNRTYGGWLRNPAPVDRRFIPLLIGFQPSKMVQDFFHPQYICIENGTYSNQWEKDIYGHLKCIS